jgi:hypothetical protein
MKIRYSEYLTIPPSSFALILSLLVVLQTCFAGLCDLQLTAQPISQIGDGDDSEDRPFGKGFEIIQIPFYIAEFQGRPIYHEITSSLIDLPDGKENCNILIRYKLLIEDSSEDNVVTLRLDSANIPANCGYDMEELTFAALECIRTVAVLYHHSPKVKIIPPKGEEQKWIKIENQFKTHDLKKPFIRDPESK